MAERRWRVGRWVALLVLGGLGMAAVWWLPPLAGVISAFAARPLGEKDSISSVIAMLVSVVSLLSTLVVGMLQLRQGHKPPAAGRPAVPVGPWYRMDHARTRALALRVHPAADLPPAQRPAGRRAARWWRPRWPRRPGEGLDPDLPTFVPRAKLPEVLEWMRAARDIGGFLLLVGDSCVGKTRLAYEAAREVLGDFTVVAPDLGDGGMVNALALDPPGRPTIVWLDELQRFLPGPHFVADPGREAVTAAAIRRLLDAPQPVVVIGTVWPEYLTELRAVDPDPAGGPGCPRHPHAVDVLSLVTRDVRVMTFSEKEKRDAQAAAARDPRLAAAVADPDYGVTEALAGARQIMRRYREATAEQQAVIHAAVDARRLGVRAALTTDLLRAAARGYLPSRRAYADDGWFDAALAEVTSTGRRDDASTAPLLTVLSPDRAAVLGYTVTDYLLQHLTRDRRAVQHTAATWHALITHVHDPDDLVRLAHSADRRMLYDLALPLYRRSADTGDWFATYRLARLLVDRGDVDELRARADTGDRDAAEGLADLLAERGDLDELRARADTGDRDAAERLADLLAERGDLDALRARADTGDGLAAARLADLLAERDDLDARLAALLAERDDLDALRTRADTGDGLAALRLASLLAERGDLDELRARADTDNWYAAERLADLLAERGDLDELRTRADTGDWLAALRLADLLAERDALDALRTRADTGDEYAAERLADLLAERDALDELRTRADTGDWLAARRLADLLAERDALDELRTRADTGDEYAALRLASLLAERGDLDELRARADTGDEYAARRLADLLAERGDLDGLWKEVHAGTVAAAGRLLRLLRDRGETGRTEELRRAGLSPPRQ